jgi:hypothetical protein
MDELARQSEVRRIQKFNYVDVAGIDRRIFVLPRSVDSLAELRASGEAAISECNRRFQQKSAEVIEVGGNELREDRRRSHKPAKD